MATWPSESLFQKPPASEAAAVGRQHFAHGVLKFASGRDGRDAPLDLHVPLLGSIPLDSTLREAGDAGEPLVIANPDTPAAAAISAVADAIADTRREQGVGFVKSLPVLS